jgi:hypothetical protein
MFKGWTCLNDLIHDTIQARSRRVHGISNQSPSISPTANALDVMHVMGRPLAFSRNAFGLEVWLGFCLHIGLF